MNVMEVFASTAVSIGWVLLSVPAYRATLWLWTVSVAMVYSYCWQLFDDNITIIMYNGYFD